MTEACVELVNPIFGYVAHFPACGRAHADRMAAELHGRAVEWPGKAEVHATYLAAIQRAFPSFGRAGAAS